MKQGYESRRLRHVEAIQVHKLLEQRFRKGADGLWRYDRLWDDERVAKSIGPRVPSSAVKSLRRELFGDEERATKLTPNAALELRISNLEARMGRVEQQLGMLDDGEEQPGPGLTNGVGE
jgi:hypothetical protein